MARGVCFALCVASLLLCMAVKTAAEEASDSSMLNNFILGAGDETESLTEQLREAVPAIDNIPELITRAGENRGKATEDRAAKKRFAKKELPVLTLARSVWNYIAEDQVLQGLTGVVVAVLLAYFLVFGQDSFRAAEIERRRTEKQRRVREIRARRTVQDAAAEQNHLPADKAPVKAEPKPGVRLSGKEVVEIIAARKAKAQAKQAKVKAQQAQGHRSLRRPSSSSKLSKA